MFRRKHWIYITFTVLIQNEVARIDKNGLENTKDKFYILQLTDSARFMAIFLSNLLNNLSEVIHTIICKFRNNHTKCETCGYKYCDCFLEYTHFRGDLVEQKCLLEQKLSTQVWWKVREMIFQYIQIF